MIKKASIFNNNFPNKAWFFSSPFFSIHNRKSSQEKTFTSRISGFSRENSTEWDLWWYWTNLIEKQGFIYEISNCNKEKEKFSFEREERKFSFSLIFSHFHELPEVLLKNHTPFLIGILSRRKSFSRTLASIVLDNAVRKEGEGLR